MAKRFSIQAAEMPPSLKRIRRRKRSRISMVHHMTLNTDTDEDTEYASSMTGTPTLSGFSLLERRASTVSCDSLGSSWTSASPVAAFVTAAENAPDLDHYRKCFEEMRMEASEFTSNELRQYLTNTYTPRECVALLCVSLFDSPEKEQMMVQYWKKTSFNRNTLPSFVGFIRDILLLPVSCRLCVEGDSYVLHLLQGEDFAVSATATQNCLILNACDQLLLQLIVNSSASATDDGEQRLMRFICETGGSGRTRYEANEQVNSLFEKAFDRLRFLRRFFFVTIMLSETCEIVVSHWDFIRGALQQIRVEPVKSSEPPLRDRVGAVARTELYHMYDFMCTAKHPDDIALFVDDDAWRIWKASRSEIANTENMDVESSLTKQSIVKHSPMALQENRAFSRSALGVLR